MRRAAAIVDRSRRALTGAGVLAVALMLAVPALGQTMPPAASLPDIGAVTGRTGPAGMVPGVPPIPVPTVPPSVPADAPVFTLAPQPGGTDLRIDLRSVRTILDWRGTGFNIAAGNSVSFRDARSAGSGAIAVLNRDLSGRPSRIDGAIRSDANVAVYLINSRGILFGGGARIDVGSFLASTRDVGDRDFLDGDGRLSFGAQQGDGAIVFSGPARLRATGSAASGDAADGRGERVGDIVLLGTVFGLGRIQDAPQDPDAPQEGEVFIGAGPGGQVVIAGPTGPIIVQNRAGSPLLVAIDLPADAQADAASQPQDGLTAGALAGRNLTVSAALLGAAADEGAALFDPLTATHAHAADRGVVLTTPIATANRPWTRGETR
jgi:filamentous hemagglutinin family protein